MDQALLDGHVDACVHSVKDIETLRPERIALAAMLPRADVRERLVGATSIATSPPYALIGTSSPRPAAQLRHARSDLQITAIRGNVATRLAKMERGGWMRPCWPSQVSSGWAMRTWGRPSR
jgi:hydroxymethylbilane synthase